MITDYACFWPNKKPRCEVLTCRADSTHILHMDKSKICLCDFHIGKFTLIALSVQSAGCTVSVHKIGVEVQR